MIDVSIDRKDITRIRRQIHAAGAAERQQLGRLHRNIAQIPAKAAKARAPVWSGRLQRAIKAKGNKVVSGVVAKGYNLVQLGIAGKQRVRPRPFIERAAAATKPRWKKAYIDGLQKIIGRHINVEID